MDTNQDSRLLAAAIRRRRKSVGLTQLELADLADCGVAFIYALEQGKPTVRLDKVLAVLHVLGLTLMLTEGEAPLSVAPRLSGDPPRNDDGDDD